MTILFACAAILQGGVIPEQWNLCLLGLGLLALAFWRRARRAEHAPPLDRGLRLLLLLLPCYVAFQLLPLPAFLLKIVSPERAELLAALAQVAPGDSFAPLAVAPAATLAHLAGIAGYTLVFLMVRGIAWGWSYWRWAPAMPIIGVAVLEAALGLWQYAADPAAEARGTYVNRNHFAGLLEMSLPFAVMYPVALLHRRGQPRYSATRRTIQACAVLSLAAVIFLGILVSSSRMGFVAALCSLFVVGALALRPRRVAAWKKKATVALLAALVVVGFVLLPPDQLIRRFARLSSADYITAEGRLQLWGETLQLIAAYPVFGCGLGGYESAFLKYKASEPLVRDDVAHNDYLQFLAELGLIGFVIGLALMLAVMAKALRAAAGADMESRCLALACLGAFSAIAIHSIVDFNLAVPANAMLLAWICGLSASLALLARRPPGTKVVEIQTFDGVGALETSHIPSTAFADPLRQHHHVKGR